MKKIFKNKISRLAIFLLPVLLTSCFNTTSEQTSEDHKSAIIKTGDPYRDQLISMGFSNANIKLGDMGYIVEGDLVFTKETLNEIRNKKGLAKSSQNRTDFDGTGLDIKNLDGVSNVQIVFVAAVGPNWRAAAQTAVNSWNNISGTAVNFSIVTSCTGPGPCIIVDAFALGNDFGIACGGVFPTADNNVATQMFVNVSMEANVPGSPKACDYATAKTRVFMHELGHTLNIFHTDGVPVDPGFASTHIAGTTTTDGVASIFHSETNGLNYNLSSFTSNDVLAIQFMYPSGAVMVKRTDNVLVTEGLGPRVVATNVNTFQQYGERIFVLQNDGTLIGKDGLSTPTWVTIQTGVAQFKIYGNRIAYVNTAGGVYAKDNAPPLLQNGWSDQRFGEGNKFGSKVDLAGDRIIWVWTSAQSGGIKGKDGLTNAWYNLGYGVDNLAAQVEVTGIGAPRIAAIFSGNLKARDNLSGGWSTLKTGVQSFQLYRNRIGLLYNNGNFVARDGLGTTWPTPYPNIAKFHMDGTRIGVLWTGGSALEVKEGLTGAWNMMAGGVSNFKLKGYYTSYIDFGGQLSSVYDLTNWAQFYSANALSFGIID